MRYTVKAISSSNMKTRILTRVPPVWGLLGVHQNCTLIHIFFWSPPVGSGTTLIAEVCGGQIFRWRFTVSVVVSMLEITVFAHEILHKDSSHVAWEHLTETKLPVLTTVCKPSVQKCLSVIDHNAEVVGFFVLLSASTEQEGWSPIYAERSNWHSHAWMHCTPP